MNYQQAITTVKGGTNVKREGWSNKYLRKHTDDAGNTIIQIVETRTVIAPYVSPEDDIMTDDWESL